MRDRTAFYISFVNWQKPVPSGCQIIDCLVDGLIRPSVFLISVQTDPDINVKHIIQGGADELGPNNSVNNFVTILQL